MGLDVYVGPLTRYYLKNWETVVQKYGREHDMSVQIVRPQDDEAQTTPELSPDEALAIVTAWRSSVGESLSKHLSQPFEWTESSDGPYFTDKPAWDGYSNLVLLAAYDEHPEMPRPSQPCSDWSQDPAWKASTANDYKSRYRSVLLPELWLPVPFDFVFRAPDAADQEVWMGSSIALHQQLRDLNDRTFKASPDQISQWRRDNFEKNDPFETAARFGLAVFMELTAQSARHLLPMKLDY